MDWREERAAALAGVKRVVVKVGSAVLAGPEGLDSAVIDDLAAQIAGLHGRGLDVVLVSSGAVAAGRRVVGVATRDLPSRQAASAVGQSRLMHAWDQAFGSRGIVTAQVLLTHDGLEMRDRFLNALNTFRTLLSWRAVPVVNENDTVAVQELVFGDNDTLASLVLNVVEADLLVSLTSARGVFDCNPAEHPGAEPLSCIEDIAGLDVEGVCSGKTADGSGGMYAKLLAARRAAQLGVPTLILAGREPQAMARAFAGEDLGTWVRPADKRISRRKFWMAYNNKPAGVVVVDAGAARALRERGKSLLPAGIRAVEGEFEPGSLVRIVDAAGAAVGVGLTNYGAGDLAKIMGKHSSQIEGVLGQCAYPEAVHRDDLLLDAAI